MAAFADPNYPLKIRQPFLVVAAGQDQIVSTPAIDEFAIRLRAGSQLIMPGARHELLMEQDRCRGQALAGFDAFGPGTPLFAEPFSNAIAAACARLSPAAMMRPPPFGEPP